MNCCGGWPLPRSMGSSFDERCAVGVDEVGAGPGLHVGVEPLGQADLLPDAHDLLVGGDGAGAEVDVRVALDDHDLQADLAQQVGGGGADRAVSDDRHVVGRVYRSWLSLICRRPDRGLVL